MTKRVRQRVYYAQYIVTGTVVFGDWEGSADVERGRNWIPPYVDDDFTVIQDIGRMFDATDYIAESMREDMQIALIQRAAEEMDR